jgi:pteridine reductase
LPNAAATSSSAGRPVALVTGAGRRVGRALAVALGTRGYDIAVHYNASRAAAEQTAKELAQRGGRALLFGADLSAPESPAQLVRDVAAGMGQLDVVVNSAAVMLRTPFGEVAPEVWDRILSLNLRAPFLIAQEAAKYLPEGGVIVNIADLSAFEAWPSYIPHGVSKAGLVQLTRALARVLAPRVRVNAVAPGTVLLPEGWREDDANRMRETTPLRRWGSPDDVSQAVLYLIDAPYVTGETLIVDGGRHVRR